MQPLYLIDASIYIFRAYFALPPRWTAINGFTTEAVYGYGKFLLDLLAAKKPTRLAAAYDESLGSCFRNRLYPAYKISRVAPDEALAFQLRACRTLGELLGIRSYASARYEADDLIGTLLSSCPGPVCIVSRDKDLGQLLRRDQGDCLWDAADDKREDYPALQQRFGVRPEQLADYLALVGDTVDDIPGVPGVGPKSAAALLQAFDAVEDILSEPDRVAQLTFRGAKSLAAKLPGYGEQIRLAKALATIACDAPLTRDSKEAAPAEAFAAQHLLWQGVDWEGLGSFCETMGLQSLNQQAKVVL